METADKPAEIKYEKFTEDEWGQIDKPLTELEIKVSNILKKLGDASNLDELEEMVNELPYQICGETLYLEKIRPVLVSKKIVPKRSSAKDTKDPSKDKVKDKKGKEKKGGKGKKAQENKQKEMERRIVEDRIEKELHSVINNFESERKDFSVGFHSNSKILELKLISLLYYTSFYAEAFEDYEAESYEVLVGLLKILSTIEKLSGPSVASSSREVLVSYSMFEDLRSGLTVLAKKVGFSVQHMFQNYPRLIISTNFDSFFSGLDIKPYPSQVQLLDKLKLEYENKKPALILYRAMIGSGKTSSSIALASFAKKVQQTKNENLVILYVCSLKNVRHQVGKLAQGSGINMAVAAMWDLELELQGFLKGGQKADEYTENKMRQRRALNSDAYNWQEEISRETGSKLLPRQINHNSCRTNRNPELIVTDMMTARFLLQNKKILYRGGKGAGYEILPKEKFILFLDEPTVNYGIVDSTIEMVPFFPPFTIFSSATLPAIDKLETFLEFYRSFHPTSKIHTVHSVDSNVGTQLMSFKYKKKVPHLECTTKEEVLKIANKITVNGFLARLYNGVNVFELYNRMRECKVEVDDLEEYFLEPSHLSQTHIQKKAHDLLKTLSSCDPQVITQVCDLKNFEEKLTQVEKEELNIKKSRNLKLEPSSLLTSNAHKFMGGCLIGVAEPLKFVEEHFKAYTDELKTLSHYLKRFEKDQAKFDKEIQVLFDTIKNEENLYQQIDLRQNNRPVIKFPEDKRINSLAHLRLNFKNNLEKHHFVHIQKEVFFDEVPMTSTVMDWLVQLLICGVGVYQTDCEFLDKEYLDAVMDLASQRKLSYLVSNAELSYGTNIPVNHVVIFDDLGVELGLGSIFQLMGRAGRVGQSWSAYAHIESKTLQKIVKFIKSDDVFLEEAEERDITAAVGKYAIQFQDQIQQKTKINKESLTNSVSSELSHYGIVINYPSLEQFFCGLVATLFFACELEKEGIVVGEKEFAENISAFNLTFMKSFANGYYTPIKRLKELMWFGAISKNELKAALKFADLITVFVSRKCDSKVILKLKSTRIKIIEVNPSPTLSLPSQVLTKLQEINGNLLEWKFPIEISKKRENMDFIPAKFTANLAVVNPEAHEFTSQLNQQIYVMLEFYYNKLKSDYEHISLGRVYPFFAFNDGMVNEKLVDKILEEAKCALEPLEYFCFDSDIREELGKLSKEKFGKALKTKESKGAVAVGKRFMNSSKIEAIESHLLRAALGLVTKMGIGKNVVIVQSQHQLKAIGLIRVKAYCFEGGSGILEGIRKECLEVFSSNENYIDGAVQLDCVSKWEMEF